ncbi:5'-nucleotidase C-terminal domain-containing protein [Abyssalbus ytuae]|uniref:5'-nucleotidase C-terminal domain-containing protein n=1 Tax=Abyssalbus ytuae TaxID=2926907 RepID=A0A9E6ZTT9_9FLAO|nr:5'-nucleotidase [Abyssalbus ytuae]UOB17683.1 5'-nucleotidase C-terminal domain-containing protein [Abyssalbus ytuae]
MNLLSYTIKHFVIFITLFLIYSCDKHPDYVSKISGKEIHITDSLKSVDSIENFIKPYRSHINDVLDEALAYSPEALSKSDGELNTAIGNLLADIVMEQTNPVFKSRTGKNIDFVLLNHGGIRSIISKGNITTRTAYQVMPFENKVVVVEITTDKLQEMINYLIKSNRAHPVSGIKIVLNDNNSLQNVLVQGKPIEKDKTYFVATSDYLSNMGDNMTFFSNPVSITETDYLIRNEMIDYFKKTDTIKPIIDDRFIRL